MSAAGVVQWSLASTRLLVTLIDNEALHPSALLIDDAACNQSKTFFEGKKGKKRPPCGRATAAHILGKHRICVCGRARILGTSIALARARGPARIPGTSIAFARAWTYPHPWHSTSIAMHGRARNVRRAVLSVLLCEAMAQSPEPGEAQACALAPGACRAPFSTKEHVLDCDDDGHLDYVCTDIWNGARALNSVVSAQYSSLGCSFTTWPCSAFPPSAPPCAPPPAALYQPPAHSQGCLLTVGDSITAGLGLTVRRDLANATAGWDWRGAGGWRPRLWRSLLEMGLEFQWTGSSTSYLCSEDVEPISGQAFPPFHESVWGWRSDEALPAVQYHLDSYSCQPTCACACASPLPPGSSTPPDAASRIVGFDGAHGPLPPSIPALCCPLHCAPLFAPPIPHTPFFLLPSLLTPFSS